MYKKNMGRDLSGICTIFKVFTYSLFLMNSQQVFALFGKLFHIKKLYKKYPTTLISTLPQSDKAISSDPLFTELHLHHRPFILFVHY